MSTKPGQVQADIVLPRHRLAVQVFGCFWHAHGCRVGGKNKPSGPNAEAWEAKRQRVRRSEERAKLLLAAAGFDLVVVWECEIRGAVEAVAGEIADRLNKSNRVM